MIMATPADSRAVKSLNYSQGTNKFVVRLLVPVSCNYRFRKFTEFVCLCGCMQFKKVGEKMEDTKTEVVNVFKSLEKVKAEPSQGSTFLKDRLVELRVCYSDQSFNLSSIVLYPTYYIVFNFFVS